MPPPAGVDLGDWIHWSNYVVRTIERLDVDIKQQNEFISTMDQRICGCILDLERAQNEKNTEFAVEIRTLQIRIAYISAAIAAGVSVVVSAIFTL